jgi:hypothetical protein
MRKAKNSSNTQSVFQTLNPSFVKNKIKKKSEIT